MILEENPFRPRRMHDDLVHALAEFRIPLGHVHNADATVARLPGAPAVFGGIDPAGRNGHVHPVRIPRVEQDGMQGQPSQPRHPARAVRMVEQAAHQRPGLAVITGFIKRRRFDAAIDDVRLLRPPRTNLPDVLERGARFGRKPNRGFRGIGPGSPVVITGAQERAPQHTEGRSPQTMPSFTPVIGQRVGGLAVKVRPRNIPARSLRRRSQQENSFRGPDH